MKGIIMTNNKHTPAPWYRTETYGRYITIRSEHSNRTVARVPWGKEGTTYDDADSRLIAAAPELLEALETIICSDNARLCQSEWEAGRAAIAKAKGE